MDKFKSKSTYINPECAGQFLFCYESVSQFFNNINQPTERQVRNAMVLIIYETGAVEGSMCKYKLKAGGGTRSDNLFEAGIFGLITDEKGEDKEVIYFKKYSHIFNEVLITPENFLKAAQPYFNDEDINDFLGSRIAWHIGYARELFRMTEKQRMRRENYDLYVSHILNFKNPYVSEAELEMMVLLKVFDYYNSTASKMSNFVYTLFKNG